VRTTTYTLLEVEGVTQLADYPEQQQENWENVDEGWRRMEAPHL
jgi:hypothetical protein